MKLSISNIGWSSEQDNEIYGLMKKYGYEGLEIAPTRVFPETPYDKLDIAEKWGRELKAMYGFSVPSMQSIWYGRQEKIFGSEEERNILLDYTKKAVDFAAVIGCKNLVFGCPRNRNLPAYADTGCALAFFKEAGDYAEQRGTVIGLEANPPIYNTNYINDTKSAIELIKEVGSKGFMLNLDIGTMIYNEEDISELEESVNLINHVHISEPGLGFIKERSLHKELRGLLSRGEYAGYISIEVGEKGSISVMEEEMQYIRGVFS